MPVEPVARVEPSGFRIVIVAVALPPGMTRARRWPEVPEKVREPFCPGTVVLTAVDVPFVRMVPDGSAGTSYNVTVAEPVAAVKGSAVKV